MSSSVPPDEVFPVSRQWRAEWITAAGDGPSENAFHYFRTEFDLDEVPRRVTAFVSADTRYQLYVNGRFVGRGVPPCQRWHQYYDERDLTGFLAPGRNCIAAVVNHLGGTDLAGEGLLVEVTDGEGRLIVASGRLLARQRRRTPTPGGCTASA